MFLLHVIMSFLKPVAEVFDFSFSLVEGFPRTRKLFLHCYFVNFELGVFLQSHCIEARPSLSQRIL